MDGRDACLAHSAAAWRAVPHDRRGSPVRDRGRPAASHRGRDAQRGPCAAVARGCTARAWHSSAPTSLLRLRLLNALVFALAVGVAAGLAVALVAEPFPQWLVFPFLFVPALPFFATHVSETAILASIYVLLGTCTAVVCLDGPRAHWTGPPLGLATGLMLASGRSPWPLAPLILALLVARILLGPPGTQRPVRAALVFWVGMGLGAAIFMLLWNEPYRLMTEAYAVHVARFLPGPLRATGQWLLAHPAGGGSLAAGRGGARAGVRSVAHVRGTELRGRGGARDRPGGVRSRRTRGRSRSWDRSSSSYPQLPLEPVTAMTAAERTSAVLRTMATMFRLAAAELPARLELLARLRLAGHHAGSARPGPAGRCSPV